jgi:glutathione peroxidase
MNAANPRPDASLYDFEVATIDGQPRRLDAFRGQVLLVVNVASRCGFTPQYADLEALYRRHRAEGFAVLGFPCNQFLQQEPLDEAQIKKFCSLSYDVTFPLFAKVEVNGPAAHPLYRFLKAACRGILGTKAIKWNFTKFLIDRHGTPIRRYAPRTGVERIERDLRPLLGGHGGSADVGQ